MSILANVQCGECTGMTTLNQNGVNMMFDKHLKTQWK